MLCTAGPLASTTQALARDVPYTTTTRYPSKVGICTRYERDRFLKVRPNQTRPGVPVSVFVRRDVEPAGRSGAPGGVAPGAATDNTRPAARGSCRIDFATTGVGAVPIVTPLPYVAQHVVQTIGICGLGSHWVRRAARVAKKPGDRVQRRVRTTCRSQLSRVRRRRRSPPRRVFPLLYRLTSLVTAFWPRTE